MIALVLALLTVQAVPEKPDAVAIGCKKQKLVGRALAGELKLVPGAQVNALVRRQHLDSKTREGLVAIAEAFEVELLVRCTKGQGKKAGMLEVIDSDGTILSRRPLKLSKRASERRLFSAWLRAGVRDALAGAAGAAETIAVQSEVPAEGDEDAREKIDEEVAAEVAANGLAADPQPIAAQTSALESTPEIESTPAVDTAPTPSMTVQSMAAQSTNVESANVESANVESASALETSLEPEGDRPTALLLLGASMREKTLGAEQLTLRTRLLATSSLEAELTTGVDRDRDYRFLFTTAYLFDIFGAGFGPSIALGLDPNAPASDRVARAGVLLLIPIISDALSLRLHGGYRPITSKDLTRVLGHGYTAGGSIEGSFDGGFSYALRADYQAVDSERALGLAALIGWRF